MTTDQSFPPFPFRVNGITYCSNVPVLLPRSIKAFCCGHSRSIIHIGETPILDDTPIDLRIHNTFVNVPSSGFTHEFFGRDIIHEPDDYFGASQPGITEQYAAQTSAPIA